MKVNVTSDERHTQPLRRLLVRGARETHERHALVGMRSTVAKNLGHADDGASEVDVACSLAVYGAVRFDLAAER